jgi:hypothetical protein
MAATETTRNLNYPMKILKNRKRIERKQNEPPRMGEKKVVIA